MYIVNIEKHARFHLEEWIQFWAQNMNDIEEYLTKRGFDRVYNYVKGDDRYSCVLSQWSKHYNDEDNYPYYTADIVWYPHIHSDAVLEMQCTQNEGE